MVIIFSVVRVPFDSHGAIPLAYPSGVRTREAKKPQAKAAIYFQKSDGVVDSPCSRDGEMLDLLRIVDDGAAGRRGGHLRITECFNGEKRGEYTTWAEQPQTQCLGYVHDKIVIGRLLLYIFPRTRKSMN